jgi:hypothetical protein
MPDMTAPDVPQPRFPIDRATDPSPGGSSSLPATAVPTATAAGDPPTHETNTDHAATAAFEPAPAAVLNLLRRIKALEEPDGSWPGADVVDAVTEWFATFGISPDAPLGAVTGAEPLPCRHCRADIWTGPLGSQVWQDRTAAIHCHPGTDRRGACGLDCAGHAHQPRLHEPIEVDLGDGRSGLVIAIEHDAETGQDTWAIRPVEPGAPVLRMPAAHAAVMTADQ